MPRKDDEPNLHSQTLPWGAVWSTCTLKSRPARSCRSCALSMPSTRSGRRNRWSIPSSGPCCCCWCLLVAVGVTLDAVSILNNTHLTSTNENHINIHHDTIASTVWGRTDFARCQTAELTMPTVPEPSRHGRRQTGYPGSGRGEAGSVQILCSGVNERQPCAW
jgi:hypothetical protein